MMSPNHPNLALIDGVLFSKSDNRLVFYPPNKRDTEYDIPNGTAGIDDKAFLGCFYLNSITIPDSVTSIGINPFTYCNNLTSIKVSPNHPSLTVIDGVLFSKSEKRLIFYPSSKEDTEYVIPEGTTSIDDRAFSYCGKLTSITIPDSVTHISIGALPYESTFIVGRGSYAEEHCKSINLSYQYPDSLN